MQISTEYSNPQAPLTNRYISESQLFSRFYSKTEMTEDEFWQSLALHFGIENKAAELALVSHKKSPAGIHNRYQQYFKRIPVNQSELLINLGFNDNVKSIFSNIKQIPDDFSVNPSLTAAESAPLALMGINRDNLRGKEEYELSIVTQGDYPILAYIWRIPASEPYGDWEVIVDANSGEVISRRDIRMFDVTGSGQVFIPDPKTAIESDTLFDNNDASWAIPPECYSTVDLLELDDAVGSYYYLTGPYCNTEPTEDRAAEPTPDFFYDRFDDRFEEVNTYYHIDTYQRYIQYLGFDDIKNHSQPFNVNGTTDDNSWFSPMTGIITLGSGGVDDGEDADVIIHEYGHAIQWDIIPGWSGGHTGAMGEGFGDFLAGTYSLTLNPNFHPDWVFTWDGHNQYWAGRFLDMPYHYPENANGAIHDSGQLWSAGLIDVWYDVPDVEAWERIVFQHHYYLGNDATMEDAANAILLADIDINNIEYRDIIIENFVARGFLDPNTLAPQITHEPLGDSEDTLQTEFAVQVQIASTQPLDTSSVELSWGTDGVINQTIPLQYTGSDTFAAVITGPFTDTDVCYYISAADIYGGLGFAPAAGPPEMYEFHIGPDLIAPEFSLIDSLPNTVLHYGTQEIRITATDNIGLSLVEFFYQQEGGSFQSVAMTETAEDTFSAIASWSGLNSQSYYYYYFELTDISAISNLTQSDLYNFQVVSEAVFDDFESGLLKWDSADSWRVQSNRVFTGSHALNDRNEDGYTSGEEVLITLAKPWDTRDLPDLHMDYWTQYFLVPQNDTGCVEISTLGGWEILDIITGAIGQWEKRTVSFADFLPADSVLIRFRTLANTTVGNPTLGWFIDDIILSTEPLVAAENLPETKMIGEFILSGVYPNPGNGRFTVDFALPEARLVKLSVYDILGREAYILPARKMDAGSHSLIWEANVSSGIYFIRLDAASESKVSKILLIR